MNISTHSYWPKKIVMGPWRRNENCRGSKAVRRK